jgi:bifunctional oligoribonuclease and PAP phosphatase NrnA
MLTFDCGSIERLNELAVPAAKAHQKDRLIVVDHHATNTRYGSINIVDEGAAATAVVVRRLAQELGWPLNREAAWCLYVGLAADTGRFQYGSTNSAVFGLAEELSSFDLPIGAITRELFEENRFAYLQLAALALSRAQLDVEHAFVSTFVTQEDLARFDVRYEEAEGLIDWIRTTSEAEVACVCKEVPGGVRVSLRSLSKVDVGSIAVSLGGGGHRLAAGFAMNATVGEVLAEVKRRLPIVETATGGC